MAEIPGLDACRLTNLTRLSSKIQDTVPRGDDKLTISGSRATFFEHSPDAHTHPLSSVHQRGGAVHFLLKKAR